MEDTQDLIFEIEGNVGSVGSSDLLGVVSLVMTGGTEALHLGKTSDSFEQQTGKKAKTVSRSLARTTTNIWETGNKKILRQVYSNHLPVERPTPKNFIIRLAEYLKRQTIRKQDTPLNGLERNETIPKEPNVHQKAVMLLLVFSLSLGSLMAVSQTVRAAVVRRVVEWYETHITYRHSGEQIAGDMPWYEITDLLEGYGEIES